MKFSFGDYKTELKRAILNHPSLENPEERIYEASWLSYALSTEGKNNNHTFLQLLKRIEKWAKNCSVTSSRDIGPLSLVGYLLPDGEGKAFSTKVSDILERIKRMPDTKWSPLNEPTLIFAVSLFAKLYASNIKDRLVDTITKSLHGPLWRRLLLQASLVELGVRTPSQPADKPVDERDIIILVWFAERYLPRLGKSSYWERFASIKDSLTTSEKDAESLRLLDAVELALLYEAINRQAEEPDPLVLFRNYPFEPEIQAVEKLFANEQYGKAIEEASLKLKEVIERISGERGDDETALLDKTIRPDNPILKFNDYLDQKSGKNEQSGLYNIAKGIFLAFRNPPAHIASGHPLIAMEAREALDKLIIINYLVRRVKQSKK
ncbi:MAG: TIGR02391 family protein [Candidatus Methanomethylicaceae archaeon]